MPSAIAGTMCSSRRSRRLASPPWGGQHIAQAFGTLAWLRGEGSRRGIRAVGEVEEPTAGPDRSSSGLAGGVRWRAMTCPAPRAPQQPGVCRELGRRMRCQRRAKERRR